MKVYVSARIQKRSDGKYFIYLSKRYEDLWDRLRKEGIPILVRIEIPE